LAYIVGISSGFFGAAPQEEKLQYVTLSKKAMFSITQGVSFTQIDVESMAEFKEPNLKENIENVKRLNISFGIHGETGAFGGGREVPLQLDSANEEDYIRSHKRLVETLTQAGEIGSKYYLMHASESHPYILLAKDLQPSRLVDFEGKPFFKFLEEKKALLEWLVKNHEKINMLGLHVDYYMEKYSDKKLWEERMKKYNAMTDEQKKQVGDPRLVELLTPEEKANAESEGMKEGIKVYVMARDSDWGPERFAYFVVAKWMEMENDPLWKPILEVSKKFYLKPGEEKDIGNFSVENEKFYTRFELWVPAVAARYLLGHFFPDKELYEDPKKVLDKYDIDFVIETPMASPGMENLMRLANPVHMYHIAKEANEKGIKHFKIAIDCEHILGNYLDPKKIVEELPEGGGTFVKVMHLGWPTPMLTAHMPIYLGSEQQKYIYEIIFALRQKGFSSDEDRYIIYERGSTPIAQTITAMKLIVKFAEQNVDPNNLPLKEFYGVETGEVASFERQKEIMEEHARDPLKGMLVATEEKHGFLGRAAIEKGKRPEEWEKEEHR
jgi:hypothetical protein